MADSTMGKTSLQDFAFLQQTIFDALYMEGKPQKPIAECSQCAASKMINGKMSGMKSVVGKKGHCEAKLAEGG